MPDGSMPHGDAEPERPFGNWRPLLIAARRTCMLALYNHFALTYSDTGNHLDNARDLGHGHRPRCFFRPLTYGIFLAPFANPFSAVGVALLALRWALPRLGGAQHRPFRLFGATVFLGLVVNAGVLATLSTVHPRYQSGVVWLVVLVGAGRAPGG